MPRPAYIFLKLLLMVAAAMLGASAALFAFAPDARHLAVLLLENPAGVLLLGLIALAVLLDRLG